MAKDSKASNLLRRFPIVDLSHAVALDGDNRRKFLQNFVDRNPTMSYASTRDACAMIYGVQKPLFDTPLPSWTDVDKFLNTSSRPGDLDRNIEASRHLFNLVRPRGYVATECDVQTLRVRLKQVVSIGLTYYVTEKDRLLFQYPLVRKSTLTDSAANVLGSIIRYAYAQGDFEDAEIEIADISCPKPQQPRYPRIRSVAAKDAVELRQLTAHIDEVYEVLREMIDKPS